MNLTFFIIFLSNMWQFLDISSWDCLVLKMYIFTHIILLLKGMWGLLSLYVLSAAGSNWSTHSLIGNCSYADLMSAHERCGTQSDMKAITFFFWFLTLFFSFQSFIC